MVKEPCLVEKSCNGSGICENARPLETQADIEVFAVSSRTPIIRRMDGEWTQYDAGEE